MCRNCPALKRDYGKALYERDQARKHLQIANFRPEDVLKHDEADGMVIFLSSFYIKRCLLILTLTAQS